MSGRDMSIAASKATSTNPKDLLGNAKVSYTKVPAIAVAHTAMAMMDGAGKYGAYNWRDKEVIASIYVDAAKRHLDCWFEGQQVASDSKVHHLGHAMACCAILLDAESKGKLVDDRPLDDEDLGFMERQLELMSITIKKKRAEAADRKEKEEAANEEATSKAVQRDIQKIEYANAAQRLLHNPEVVGTCDLFPNTPHWQNRSCCHNWKPV